MKTILLLSALLMVLLIDRFHCLQAIDSVSTAGRGPLILLEIPYMIGHIYLKNDVTLT